METLKNFTNLVNISGDSTLLDYKYQSSILELILELDELDEDFELKIKTNIVRAILPKQAKPIFYTCRLELLNLSEQLSQQNGYYIPHSNFGQMKRQVNTGVSLAYGLNINEAKWCLNVIGYERLISCIVNNLKTDITYSIRK